MKVPAFLLHFDWLILAFCFVALLMAVILVIALFRGGRVTVGPGARFTFVKAK